MCPKTVPREESTGRSVIQYNSNYTAIRVEEVSPASNFTLIALRMTNCKIPSTFVSLLANYGHADAELLEIVLVEMMGELQGAHVRGLRKVRKIVLLSYSDAQKYHVFHDLIDDIPDLEEFDVTLTKLRLEGREGDDSIEGNSRSALRSLSLTYCEINDVPPGAFARLGNVTLLDLSFNIIKNFTMDAFRGLTNLESLDLSNNPITSLPPRAFAFTPRLRRLVLDRTQLRTVPSEAFQGLQHLEEITYSGNDTITFGARALALSSLKELMITSALQSPLPKDLIEGSVNLKTLIIRHAGLKIIPKGFFATQQRLQKLDLSGNEALLTLDADGFQPLKELDDLNLSGNRIKEIPGNIFFGLRKLKTVLANNNSLQYIAANAFDYTSPITHLALNDNQLTSEVLSSQDVFRALPNLKTLHLQGNRISYVIPDWKMIEPLEMLDLSRNNFTALEVAGIVFTNFRLEIYLRENHITNIKFNFPTSILSVFETRVFLGDNPFRCDCELYKFINELRHPPISNNVSRITLDPEHATCASPPTLAGTLIRNLPLTSLTCSLPPGDCPANCTCDVCPETRTLELDCESELSIYPNPEDHGQETTILHLRNLPSQPLTLPSHVVSLNLAGVGLTKPPLLKTQHNIKKLDLSRNQLTDAPLELLKENISLRLSGNEFVCDCSHLASVYALQSNYAWIDDAENVTCKGGDYLMHIKVEKLCEIRKERVIGDTLAVLGGLVALVAGLAYRYSLEIKVFLFSRGWCQSWVHEDDIDNAEYDAFVSFSQDDAQWVAEQLLPTLEGEPNNYKLCVHYRDWVVGDMIPAQIATSVEQSRRTIVVLTKNFLKSTWAPLEFRAANAHAQRERRARVLVVVLGEIPDCEEMDAELRAYLSTNTYLKWGDPWFWEKLKYAMPHRPQNVE
ncbi:hypothetical protein ABMA28_012771 [Loxostege sticticalis]|uniref:TIR domain-containing protein n=1 Tax=Loxostege sticticalis TaxID=481309 RepID=A0ABD0S6F0_LOXSC